MVYPAIKRVMDTAFAALFGALFLPFGLLLAAIIRLESKGPAMFRQRRVGKDLKVFTIYKYRTMRVETQAGGRQLSDMERMTKIGGFLRRISLDEVPQVLNILRGEMSFIGPRPLLVEYIPRYTPFQMRRHEVRPGISGWSQVNGRNAIGWEEKFKKDVWYVDNMSFTTDCKIFFLTIAALLRRSGVNQSERETMQAFTGEGGEGINA